MRILIVDDDPGIRKMLGQGLSMQGHDVLEADNGKEALDLVHANALDVVMTDVFMPVMDGFEFLKELRLRDSAIPVIAISGGGRYMDEELLLRLAEKLGVSCTLLKPFSLTEVHMALDATVLRQTNNRLRNSQRGVG